MALQLQEDTRSRLSSVLREAEEAGISSEELERCLSRVGASSLGSEAGNEPRGGVVATPGGRFSLRRLRRRCTCTLHFLLFRLLPLAFALRLLYHPASELAARSPCLLARPEVLTDLLMYPPSDCEFCRGVDSAPRLSNLTRERFVREYAYTSRPVLAAGAALNWSAIDRFSYDFFKELYLSTPGAIDSDEEAGQFFPYASDIRNLRELFSLSSEEATMAKGRWYIGW